MATKNTDYRKQCIKAAFFALPDRLQALIDKGQFDKGLLEGINLGEGIPPLPVWRIPQLWKIAIGVDIENYIDTAQDDLRDFVARNDAVMDIFVKTFGVEYSTIDFQKYHECFYSEEPDWSYEDFTSDVNPEFLLEEFGTRPQDIELFCAVERFDFTRVKELLEQGATPYAKVYEDGSCNCYERIEMENSFLCTCQLCWAWSPERYSPIGEREIGDLIGWAAHETMYQWLDKYNTFPSPIDEDFVIPTSIGHAFSILDGLTSYDEKMRFITQSKSDFCLDQHENLGLWIRNNWLNKNSDCFRMISGMSSDDVFFEPADIVSDRFLGKYYDHLKKP